MDVKVATNNGVKGATPVARKTPVRKRNSWSRGIVGARKAQKKIKTELLHNGSSNSINGDVSATMVDTTTADNTAGVLVSDADRTCEDFEDSILNESQVSEAVQVTESTAGVPTKIVSIDTNRLEQILESFVQKTERYGMEKLLRLYSKLSRIVTRYLRLWDRTSLIPVIQF